MDGPGEDDATDMVSQMDKKGMELRVTRGGEGGAKSEGL